MRRFFRETGVGFGAAVAVRHVVRARARRSFVKARIFAVGFPTPAACL